MIIGIAGTFGAGKGTVVDYLKEKGFSHYSMSGFIREGILSREMEVNRDSYTIVGDEIRAAHGPGFIAKSLCERAQAAGGDAIVEALQATAEAEEVKRVGGTLLAVDADPHIRYERIRGRASEKDNVSFEDFMRVEELEMHSDDPGKHNIGGVMALADYAIQNNGALAELQAKLDEILAKLQK